MTACVVCQEREPDYEARSQACARCAGRLAGALRQIPVLVDELSGLAAEVDTHLPALRFPPGHDRAGELVPHRDPLSDLPAGPLSGAVRGARVSGSPEARLPIRIDPTDLLARPRNGSLAVAARSPWPDDQVGHQSVATVLDFWARDWADLLGEGLPAPEVGRLCGWLSDRLGWALEHHPALDEFAGDVSRLLGALFGLAGHGQARPKLMEATCPSCSLLTLIQPYPDASIECITADCQRIITPEEYAEWVRTLINETTT